MPFFSKDWRSPGEEWVKTSAGWERKRLLENMARSDDLDGSARQPHCHITLKCTREIAGFNVLNDVVKRLDFHNALYDVRRFNYICALLELLVGQQMTTLSGCTQKTVLAMVEAVATYVTANRHNPRALRRLLASLRALSVAEQQAFWGGPLGSKRLWSEHSQTIDRIFHLSTTSPSPSPGGHLSLADLPEECLRAVVLRLGDHHDLTCTAEASATLRVLVGERRVWRELTRFHFTAEQIGKVLAGRKNVMMVTATAPSDGKGENNEDGEDWEAVYHALRRLHGIKEERQYAEMLSFCRYCCCLFWRSLGHPCIADQSEYRARLEDSGGPQPPSPVLPADFLKFFSL